MRARRRGRPRSSEEPLQKGIVVRAAALHNVLVRSGQDVFRCGVRGRLRSVIPHGPSTPRGQRENKVRPGVAVGDEVEFRSVGPRRGVIEAIETRRSLLVRRVTGARNADIVAVNVDLVIITVAAIDPAYKRGLIDRYLVACEHSGLNALLCVNKIDACEDGSLRAAIEEDLATYPDLGYEVVFTSAHTGVGLDDLRARMKDLISVFTGPSGVGKTSLLNVLEPGLDLATNEVSARTGKGRHTTTSSMLLPLSEGGYVVDTPGIRSFGLEGLDKLEIRRGFKEIAKIGRGCRFRDCLHREEPECAVVEALDRDELDPARFVSYQRLVEDIEQFSAAPEDSFPDHAPASDSDDEAADSAPGSGEEP